MPLVETARVALYAEEAGVRPPTLFLNGTGGDLRKKPSIFDSHLATRVRLLAFDARGCGRSEKPDRDCTMADFADDAAALLDAMDWDHAHVVGYSFGGMVAQHFALRHPRRVNRLVLAATTSGGAGGSSFPLHEVGHLDARARARRLLPVMDTRIGAAALETPDESMRQRIALFERGYDAFMDEPGARAGRARQLAARAQHDCWEALPNITQRTLVCGGLHDGQAPTAAVAALAQRLPDAALRWYPGSHLFAFECPDFWRDVAHFLETGDA